MFIFLILYSVFINVLGFVLMLVDKKRAVKKQWRIRESVFFIISIFGGGVFVFLGMYAFRHKTKHKSFLIGIPLCALIGIVFLALLFKFLI